MIDDLNHLPEELVDAYLDMRLAEMQFLRARRETRRVMTMMMVVAALNFGSLIWNLLR